MYPEKSAVTALEWERRGIAEHEAGRMEDAIHCFRESLSQEERPFCWLGLGLCLARIGQTNESNVCLENARRLAPNSGVIRHLADAASGANPARTPSAYIAWLFNSNAADYQDDMAKLGYQAPEMLRLVAARFWQPEGKLHLLDLGCGTGAAGCALMPYAASLDGVDIAQQMLDQAARLEVYTRLFRADVHAYLRQADRKYDGILAADMLNYVGDLRELLGLMAAALEPGGQILLTVERDSAALTEITPGHQGYRLAANGRYQHAEWHVPAMAAKVGLLVADRLDMALRLEAGKQVQGSAYRLCWST